jgi:hypothetical protein
MVKERFAAAVQLGEAMRAALSAVMLAACAGGAAPADYDGFGPAHPVTVAGYDGDAMEPFISRDGRFLFFNNRNDPPDKTDLFYAERRDDRTFVFRGPVAGANSPALDGVASMDVAGAFYFVSTRSYAATLSTIYRGRFATGRVEDAAIATGVSLMRPGIVDFDAEISADGETLYVVEGDFRGIGFKPKSARIVIARRSADGFRRDPADVRLLAQVNAGALAYAPSISPDGLELIFTRVAAITATARPQIWRSVRPSTTAPFGPPRRVATAQGFVEAPSLSADGRRLYFHRRDNDRFVLYEAERNPSP